MHNFYYKIILNNTIIDNSRFDAQGKKSQPVKQAGFKRSYSVGSRGSSGRFMARHTVQSMVT